jgi:aldose 1-epimerase
MLNRDKFQATIEGKQTDLYLLNNDKGMQAAITNYGGRIVSLLVPGKNDAITDVVLGFDSLQQYQQSSQKYFGAIIGRYGSRIAKSRFKLDGKEYNLYPNNGQNTLHGGKKGFQYIVWDAKKIGNNVLELTYLSKDMEEGYPGNLDVKVIYTLTNNNELNISYYATTDKKTIVNLTNHAFFNLNGPASGNANNHLLFINADSYIPVDSSLIPLGKVEPVVNTPFDFRELTVLGKYLESDNEQIKNGRGYDHNFVLNVNKENSLCSAAMVIGDKSGIVMEVLTEEPGLQFYGGNNLNSTNIIRGGGKDDFRIAFCLETQHFPDSPNQPMFPSTVLEPGEIYKTSTVYRFSKNQIS